MRASDERPATHGAEAKDARAGDLARGAGEAEADEVPGEQARALVEKYYDERYPGVSWPAHRICLERDVYILEGLGNLEQLVGRRVRFSALPLPVPGASGSPVRAVAWEE